MDIVNETGHAFLKLVDGLNDFLSRTSKITEK